MAGKNTNSLQQEKARFVSYYKAYISSTPAVSLLAEQANAKKSANGDNDSGPTSQTAGAIKTNQNSGDSRTAAQSPQNSSKQISGT